MNATGNMQPRISREKKLKSSSGTYGLLLAIFLFCAVGMLILNDHYSTGAGPIESQQQAKLEPKAYVSDVVKIFHKSPQLIQMKSVQPQTSPLKLTKPISKVIQESSLKTVHEVRSLTLQALKEHPLHNFPSSSARSSHGVSIEDLLVHMSRHKQCDNTPIIITMAKVGSPIYWQLVENFQYTMAKFSLAPCSLMICLDDKPCLQRCREASFPCFNYVDKDQRGVSAFEQIAKLKLVEIPKASKRNVPMLIIDLDVGFRQDPRKLIGNFLNENDDIRVQKDVVFIMNRTRVGWRTWFTRSMPNLGLFLCKGNSNVSSMFEVAWRQYQGAQRRLDQPGTDQAIVQGAMLRQRGQKKLTWDYLPDRHVILIDKVFKFETTAIELGGEISAAILSNETASRDTIAVHGTCYELKAKVNALKAAGAFWNPFYYDPNRPTLTMKLLYVDHKQLQQQVLALVWLAISSGRTLILPNVLADSAFPTFLNATAEGHVMWPGFRVLFTKNYSSPLQVVEPGYYWRIAQDFSDRIPEPFILTTTLAHTKDILSLLKKYASEPRIVLNVVPLAFMTEDGQHGYSDHLQRLQRWATSSVGVWGQNSFEDEVAHTRPLTIANTIPPGASEHVFDSHRLCRKILVRPRGNRSCFDKCK